MNPDYKNIFLLTVLAILMCVTVYLIAPPVNAYTYVHQGDTINQSETYDLSGVYGFSGELGWWKYWYEEGNDHIEPDVIIDLNDIRYKQVYIDTEKWKLGNWYQWDGIGKSGHGNTFAFRINGTYKPTAQVNNSTVNATVTLTPATSLPTPTPVLTPATTPPTKKPTPTPTPTFPKSKGLPLPIEIVVASLVGEILLWRKL